MIIEDVANNILDSNDDEMMDGGPQKYTHTYTHTNNKTNVG